MASCNYQVRFPEDSQLSQRVLMPVAPTESHGMEDARFVRFTDDDGTVTYYATYTAFDGAHVAPQMLKTSDFNAFRISQLAGPAAANKGMALFPRRINGRYVALSRWDRENNTITGRRSGRDHLPIVGSAAEIDAVAAIPACRCGSGTLSATVAGRCRRGGVGVAPLRVRRRACRGRR